MLNRYTTGGWGTGQPPAKRNTPLYYDSFFLDAANTSGLLRAKHNETKSAPRFVYNVHPVRQPRMPLKFKSVHFSDLIAACPSTRTLPTVVRQWVAKLFLECDADHFPYIGPSAPGDGGIGHVDRLRCPTPAQVASWSAALKRGDVAMQAFAHSAQAETMDPGTFAAGLSFGADIAEKHGLPDKPRVLSQRDVPGLSRGVVPLLVAAGVKAISVGANDGSPPPVVPSTADCYSGYKQVS